MMKLVHAWSVSVQLGVTVKTCFSLLLVILVTLCVGACDMGNLPTSPSGATSSNELVAIVPSTRTTAGFDEFGYNYQATVFEGLADGVDSSLDGKYYGNYFYANDHLLYNWNAEWDRGMKTAWLDPNGYAGAWAIDNWNGQVPNGSGVVWQHKRIWIGPCGADRTPLPDGGYCLENKFEVIASHGTIFNEKFWEVHAISTGLGRP